MAKRAAKSPVHGKNNLIHMLDEKRNRGRRRVVIEIDTNDKRESFNARVVTMVQSFVHDDEQAVFLTTEDVEK